MYSWVIAVFAAVLFTGLSSDIEDDNHLRPVYVIGHMVNAIDEIEHFVNKGSNALELDVQFFKNGTIKKVYHGEPCNCRRNCTRSSNLAQYLTRVSANYVGKIIYLFFDLKLTFHESHSSYSYRAGEDLANHIIRHLWAREPKDSRRIKCVVSITGVDHNGTIVSFLNRFRKVGKTYLLQEIAFDCVKSPSESIKKMWIAIGVRKNILQGEGVSNCYSATYPDKRLRQEIKIRDSSNGYISKVYHTTVDDEKRIRRSLELGVDGIITNVPDLMLKVLAEPRFKDTLRLATTNDDPFIKFVPCSTSKH